MSMMPILVVASVLGVQWGWQPVAGGGIEYIIRVEPHAVEALRSGRDIFSDLPPHLQRVRSYRITVSNDPVPHEGEMPPEGAVEAAPTDNSSIAAPALRSSPSGTATAARQPVDDDPPAGAAATTTLPLSETPAAEQTPPTFQPPLAPTDTSTAPAAAVSQEPPRARREWPERRENTTSTPPNFGTPPATNSSFSNSAAPPQTAPATSYTPPGNSFAPSNNYSPPGNYTPPGNGNYVPPGTVNGPALQPPTGNWPNRPSYDQTTAAPPPNNQPLNNSPPLNNNPPANFGPTSMTAEQPTTRGEWYDPPTAGQGARNGYQPNNGYQNNSNGMVQGRNGQQSQYGERDLFGRPSYNNNAPPYSTQAQHSNATLAQNFTAAEERAVAEVESKPWMLVVALLVLFASIGLNVYLGMISWDLYERYRTTIDQLKTATEARVA